MDTNQLECFLIAAEETSFSKAAHRLFLSQSAVTHRVRQLELELGVDLFVRTTGGVVLTREGELFSLYAKEALGRLDAGRKRLAELKTEEEDKIIFRYCEDELFKILPRLSECVVKWNPNCRVVYERGESDANYEAVLQGNADFAFHVKLTDSDAIDDALFYYQLFHDPIVAVVPESLHVEEPVAADGRSVSVAEFISWTLLIYEHPSYEPLRQQIEAHARRRGCEPKVRLVSHFDELLFRLRETRGGSVCALVADKTFPDEDGFVRQSLSDVSPLPIGLIAPAEKKDACVSLGRIARSVF